jgi:hypothetical protein
VTAAHLRAWLLRLWWVLLPAFAVLVVRLLYERSCRAPHELLPEITSSSLLAWPVAMLYLGVHCWTATAYLVTVEQTGTLVPGAAAWKSVWGSDWPKIVFTAVVLGLEHSPVPFWTFVGHGVFGCVGGS